MVDVIRDVLNFVEVENLDTGIEDEVLQIVVVVNVGIKEDINNVEGKKIRADVRIWIKVYVKDVVY